MRTIGARAAAAPSPRRTQDPLHFRSGPCGFMSHRLASTFFSPQDSSVVITPLSHTNERPFTYDKPGTAAAAVLHQFSGVKTTIDRLSPPAKPSMARYRTTTLLPRAPLSKCFLTCWDALRMNVGVVGVVREGERRQAR